MAKEFDMSKYEFAIRETKTAEVISDVSSMKSEIGILYLSDFNRTSMEKASEIIQSYFSSSD